MIRILALVLVFTTVTTLAELAQESSGMYPRVCERRFRLCPRSGAGKGYPLKGDTTEIDKYGGQRATVKGTLEGNNVNIQSITAAKKLPHQPARWVT